jgi:arylsulfatase A-like enzyme
MVRWPGHIQAGSISTDIFSGLDWFPTLLAAAGDATIKDRLLKGANVGGTTFKVHLDGYNPLPYLTGQQSKSLRTDFAYYNDDGVMVAYRHEDWKAVKELGGFQVWYEPFDCRAYPSSSICVWTHTSAPTSFPISMTIGESRMLSLWAG